MKPTCRHPNTLPGGWARLIVAAVLLVGTAAHGQELEPRAFSALPTGMNFLAAGYLHSQGGLSTNPALPLQDAQLQIDTGVLAYVRALDLWGLSGKFDAIVPYSNLSGSALVDGEPRERNVSGLGDSRFRLAVNFYGAPALSLKEYAAFKPNLIVGASVQVSIPSSQYDPTKLVNLGTNRWSIRPDIGFSKAFSPFTFDFAAGVTFFSRNDDFFGGRTRDQGPLGSLQANISVDFGRGIWAALGGTYYWGGQSTVEDVLQDDVINNSRVGLTVALPINRHYSLKMNASSGIFTRAGTNFDTVGLVLQYRWGAGF
jgi:hypothetical protein